MGRAPHVRPQASSAKLGFGQLGLEEKCGGGENGRARGDVPKKTGHSVDIGKVFCADEFDLKHCAHNAACTRAGWMLAMLAKAEGAVVYEQSAKAEDG